MSTGLIVKRLIHSVVVVMAAAVIAFGLVALAEVAGISLPALAE